MKEYDVTITEVLQRTVTVEAESQEAAEGLVREGWHNEDYVLDALDFVDVDFETIEEREMQELNGGIDVLLVKPGQYPEAATIGADLKSQQAVVGGMIEAIYPFPDSVVLVLNDDGKNLGLPPNRAARTEDGDIYDIYAGTFFVAGLGEENFTSLTPAQIRKYEAIFHQPEMFLQMGQSMMVRPMPDEMVRDRSAKTTEKMQSEKSQPER